MLQDLIQSKVRVKLLSLFFTNPEARYYGRELVKLTGEHHHAIWRELSRLERVGVLTRDGKSRIKYYSANRRHPLFGDLQAIVRKSRPAVKAASKGGDGAYAVPWEPV